MYNSTKIALVLEWSIVPVKNRIQGIVDAIAIRHVSVTVCFLIEANMILLSKADNF